MDKKIFLYCYYALLAFTMWFPLQLIFPGFLFDSAETPSIAHFVLFFFLYPVMCYSKRLAFSQKFVFVAFASGILFEAGQFFLPYRQFGFMDLLINILTVLVSVIAIKIILGKK